MTAGIKELYGDRNAFVLRDDRGNRYQTFLRDDDPHSAGFSCDREYPLTDAGLRAAKERVDEISAAVERLFAGLVEVSNHGFYKVVGPLERLSATIMPDGVGSSHPYATMYELFDRTLVGIRRAGRYALTKNFAEGVTP